MKKILFMMLFSALAYSEGTFIPNGGVDCTTGSAGQVYTTNGSTCSFTTVSGSGTVTGPVSSTNNAVATWNGTVGTALKNTGVTIDSNNNVVANVFAAPVTSNACSGTITLTVASTQYQTFTSGSGSCTVVLPQASTIPTAGFTYYMNMNASGTLTVETYGGSTLYTAPSGSFSLVINTSISGSAGQWDHHWLFPTSYTPGTASLNLGSASLIIDSNTVFSTLGILQAAAFPALTGDVTTSAGSLATTVAAIQGTTVSGTTGSGNVVFSASPTLTGTVAAANATFSGTVKSGSCHLEPAEDDIGNSGSSQTLNLASYNVFTTTLNAATPAFTFSNPQAGCPYAFVFTQDGTGSRVPSFSGVTVIWSGGNHTFSTTASAVDKFSCVYNGNITSLMCDLGLAYQ